MYPKVFDNSPTSLNEMELVSKLNESQTMYPKQFDDEVTPLKPLQELKEAQATYPKLFDSEPTILGEAKLTQMLYGLTIEANGAPDASPRTGVEHEETDTKATKKKKKNNNNKRKGRRGGMKKKPKVAVAGNIYIDVDSNVIVNGDTDFEDNSNSDSDASTIVISPQIKQLWPVNREPVHSNNSFYSGPEVPVLSHYETRIISGVFDNDNRPIEGLFATCDVTEGTRIICEAPLIALPSPGDDIPILMHAYEALSPSDQALIWSLRPSNHEQLRDWSASCDALIARVADLRAIKSKDRTQQDSEEVEFLQDKVDYMCHAFRIAARFFTHRNSLTDVLEVNRQYIRPDIPVTGLFATAAKLRHSCVPNCFGKWNNVLGRFTVHAVRPIPAGEELTVSLIAEKAFYYPSSERKAKLDEHSGIICTCPACNPQHADYRMHEQTRTKLQALVAHLAHELSALSVHDHTSGPNKIALAASTIALTEKRLREAIALLQNAGCGDHEIVRWRTALRDRVLPRRDALFAALAQAKLAVARTKICYGEDHPEMRGLKGHVEVWERLVERKKWEVEEKEKQKEEVEMLKRKIRELARKGEGK
jgi:hypothetical protein